MEPWRFLHEHVPQDLELLSRRGWEWPYAAARSRFTLEGSRASEDDAEGFDGPDRRRSRPGGITQKRSVSMHLTKGGTAHQRPLPRSVSVYLTKGVAADPDNGLVTYTDRADRQIGSVV